MQNRKDRGMTRVAISCEGRSLDDRLAYHFGLAGYFLIVDSGTEEVEFLENAACRAQHGAGVSTADAVAATGAFVTGIPSTGPFHTAAEGAQCRHFDLHGWSHATGLVRCCLA